MPADLRPVDPVAELPMVAQRRELAAWLRAYADRAEAGEIRAAGIAFVTRDGNASTAWHDESGCGVTMIAAAALLAHRVVKGVDDQPEREG